MRLTERLRMFPLFFTTDGAHWYRGKDGKEPLTIAAAEALERRDALLREILAYKFAPSDIKDRIERELAEHP